MTSIANRKPSFCSAQKKLWGIHPRGFASDGLRMKLASRETRLLVEDQHGVRSAIPSLSSACSRGTVPDRTCILCSHLRHVPGTSRGPFRPTTT